MSLLSGIFDNPALRNAALSQLKKLIQSEGLEFIVVRVDPAEGLMIDMYKPGEAAVSIISPKIDNTNANA
jgi:hypothetical protein